MPLNTTEIVDAVRQLIDESSEADITDQHILDACNRALNSGYNMMAKIYPDPLVTFTDLTLTEAGLVDLPETIFEDRILHVDLVINNVYRRLEPAGPADIHEHSTANASSSYPNIWAVFERELHLKPTAVVGTVVRVYHVKTPQKLVLPQGRITRIGADYFVVDSYLNGLSTDADTLDSYFNVISFNKGDIKWSGQVKTITGDNITHKTTPARTTVLNQTVSGDQSEAAKTIRVDDYICGIEGTCIPYLPIVLENYVIQHATVDMLDRLGHDSTLSRGTLASYEKQLKTQWVGRAGKTKFKLVTGQWKRNGWR